jgi:RNA polymerase sigma factor (sigma-70 family)
MGPQTIPPTGPDLETTVSLLTLVRQGDASARERLFRRYLPIITRWARGRLPAYARGLAETDDLVQMTLVGAMARLNDFEVRREGSFLAYLRRALLNGIRDEIRRSRRMPFREAMEGDLQDHGRSVVEQAIGREALERYEAALADLVEDQREAVILRLEFGLTHLQIAEALGKSTPGAARMVVARGLAHVVEAMGEPGP